MDNTLLPSVTISGLPHNLHQSKNLTLKAINYLFGANGSGKSLTLRFIAGHARSVIPRNKPGTFAQYIPAVSQQNFFQDSIPINEQNSIQLETESGTVSGQALYQSLFEFPEIIIRIRDALQKYLGRYPNIQRRGINSTFSFLRDEEGFTNYSPNSESDGLRRLVVLLAYVYHPKCTFLAIDEPESHLHPDMINFLLEEVKYETNFGKQFLFATHSPEMIEIGNPDTFTYSYFNLKDRLRDTKIIQTLEVGADEIIKRIGHQLDLNKRAFLFSPITLFVEGIKDKELYTHLLEKKYVLRDRRVQIASCEGDGKIYDFWLLWRKLEKDARVILDYPNANGEIKINKFCKELNIDENLSLDEKIKRLEEYFIIIAPYTDVLLFTGQPQRQSMEWFFANESSIDLAERINTLDTAIKAKEIKRKIIRNEEKEWLKELATRFFNISIFSSKNDFDKKIDNAIIELQKEHPTLSIEKISAASNIASIEFKVSNDRIIFLKYSDKSSDIEIGVK